MKRILLAIALLITLAASRTLAQHEAVPHGEGHAPAGHEPQAPLLPSNLQEAQEYFLTPAIWTIIIFLILLMILYPTAWKRVLAGLKKREERIRRDIADAEEARRKAEATLGQYKQQLAVAEAKVREMISNATIEGEKVATNIRLRAQQEAEEAKERAVREIETAKNVAKKEIYREAANLATDLAEKILGRNLKAEDQQDLVRRSLEQLQTIGKD